MILATIAAAVFLLFPPEIVDLADSAIAATLFSSNMYFMMVINYFNQGANSSPLLHTWSLGVEEQFYILFPFVLYSLRGLQRRQLIFVVAALAIASFGLSAVLVEFRQVAAFYLAPSRAWELLVGALLALRVIPPVSSAALREALAILGGALLIAGCVRFYQNMPFPGVRALVPCVGAGLLIHMGASGPTQVGRLMSTRPFVFIGLMSYSLYLWHWPIIVFFRLWWAKPVGVGLTVGLFLTSCIVGALSWRWIESPFRKRTFAVGRLIFWSAAVGGTAVVCGISTALVASNGLAFTFPGEVVRLSNYLHYDERTADRLGNLFSPFPHHPSVGVLSPELPRTVRSAAEFVDRRG